MKKTFILILLLLFSCFHVYSQLLPIPFIAYKESGVWTIIDERENTLYKSNIMLDVEAYSEGLLSGYAVESGNLISIYYNNFGEVEMKTPSEKAFGFINNRAFIVKNISKDPRIPSFTFEIITRQAKYITSKKWLWIEEYSEGLKH